MNPNDGSPRTPFRILILYFTLTGNTRHIAENISLRLFQSPAVRTVDTRDITRLACNFVFDPVAVSALAFETYDAIVVGTMVWKYDAPPSLQAWMKRIAWPAKPYFVFDSSVLRCI